ncbi:dTDP-4-dehydrorhamnose 3,5-epimerase [Corynebacterium caspium]|nr:dTDP-4-dehydrorhamnose 3,5-epimerase [Corynebacterium caspium]
MLKIVENMDSLLSFEPRIFEDPRGGFLEWFKASEFEQLTGYPFDLQQANISTSVQGTLRGLHFSELPPGQAKFVTCVAGLILDVAVDIRVGSPTFGKWHAVEMGEENRKGLFLPSGFAHGFLALKDATVVYLTSNEYDPEVEHAINPFDPDIAIEWPELEYVLSDKDRNSPNLLALKSVLPSFEESRAYHNALRDSWAVANSEVQ